MSRPKRPIIDPDDLNAYRADCAALNLYRLGLRLTYQQIADDAASLSVTLPSRTLFECLTTNRVADERTRFNVALYHSILKRRRKATYQKAIRLAQQLTRPAKKAVSR